MNNALTELTARLRFRLDEVRQSLGMEPVAEHPDVSFSEALDSMGLVEYVAMVAEDCAVEPAAVEQAVAHHFETVNDLARALHAAGIGLRSPGSPPPAPTAAVSRRSRLSTASSWLAATAIRLPDAVQSAATINEALQRPPGWLEGHAGVQARRVWRGQDPLTAAANAGWDCLDQGGIATSRVGLLLVTAEAPPLLTGLAAALHHRLGLRSGAGAVEVGGACSGFLAACRLAQALAAQIGTVLIIAVEAPSHYLPLQPGPAGEAAALFGDAAAAALITDNPLNHDSVPMQPVELGTDGGAGALLQVERSPTGALAIQMDGPALALHAVKTMAQAVGRLLDNHHLNLSQLHAVVAHGGNGRIPALLARQLALPPDGVWSETFATGNLGSASLPVAWTARASKRPKDPIAWVAVGAGLTWAATVTGILENPES
jgi:3-oxoacyl-[acyl-carrier-protein] synthase-3